LLVALPGGRVPASAESPSGASAEPPRIFLRKVQPLLGRRSDATQAELSFHEQDRRGRERLRLKVVVDLDGETPVGQLREASLRAAAEIIRQALEQSAGA
jgi:hypothetical protein